MIRSLTILLLSCVVALSQPAPVLRNALTTNSLVLWISSNGVVVGNSISNIDFVKSSSITWLMTNSLGTFHISAVSSAGSGGSLGVGTNTVVMGNETNLLFSSHPGITILGTNVTGTNFIDIGPDWSVVASQTNLVAASNFLYGSSIRAVQSNGVNISTSTTNLNFVDGPGVTWILTNNPSGSVSISASPTNYNGIVANGALMRSLVIDHVGITNRLKTVDGGGGVIATDQSTNISFQVDQVFVRRLATNAVRVTNGYGIDITASSDTQTINWIVSVKTNFLFSVQTNLVNVGTADNLSFSTHPGITILGTNVTSTNLIDIGINWSFAASQTNLNTASNFLYSIAGETNWIGDAGTTNATRIGLADGKANNTNLIKTLQSGNGIVLTNEAGGTNVRVAIDPAVVLTAGSVSALRIQTNDVLVGVETNLSFIPGNGILVKGTNFAGTNKIQFSIDTSVVATLTDSSNNVTVAAGAGAFVSTNSSGNKMVYTVSSVTNSFLNLPVERYLPGTNPPAPGLDQGTNQTWRLLFDDSTNETAYYQFTLPDRYFTNANLMISWSVLASAANKSNVWKVACMVVPAAGGVSVNVDSYNSTNSFTNIVMSVGYVTNTVISCGISNAVANDFIKLKLWREGTDAFDNNSGDTAVHSLLFEYEEKKP